MATTASIVSGLTIALIGGSTYDVIDNSLDTGNVTMRREVEKSPYVKGAVQIAAIPDEAQAAMTVRVRAASGTALDTAIADLVSAVTADSWTLQVTTNGKQNSWTCYPASYSVLIDRAYTGLTARVKLVYLRHPTPVAGGF